MSTQTWINVPCTNDGAKVAFNFENQVLLSVNKWKPQEMRQSLCCKKRLTW